MKLLTIIFFISAVISVILSALAFLGKIPGKGTGIVFLIAAGIFGFCELICIWDSPKGLCLVIFGVILVNMIFVITRNEGE